MLRDQVNRTALFCTRTLIVRIHENMGIEGPRAFMDLVAIEAPTPGIAGSR